MVMMMIFNNNVGKTFTVTNPTAHIDTEQLPGKQMRRTCSICGESEIVDGIGGVRTSITLDL